MARTRFESEEAARRAAAESGGTAEERHRGWNPDTGEPTESFWVVNTPDENTNPYADEGLEDWEYDLAKVPVLNMFGGSAALDRAANLREQNSAQQMWSDLAANAPGTEDLVVDYAGERNRDEWGYLDGPDSEIQGGSAGIDGQMRAMRELENISAAGGYTRADQMARNQAAMANAQRLQGANQAALQQASMRGMSGGGAELGARLAGSQAYTHGQAMADAQIQQGAQQRAMQALAAQGQIGSSVDAGLQRRQSALDAYNDRQMQWRRDREQRNTQWRNRGRESQADASQQAYENQERSVAGSTNQYQAAQSNRRADGAREDQQAQNLVTGIGSLLESI